MTPIKPEMKNSQGHTVYTRKHVFTSERKDGFKPCDITKKKQSNHHKQAATPREPLFFVVEKRRKAPKDKWVCFADQTMEPVKKKN